jgi:Domain of unknown function (DUF1996)
VGRRLGLLLALLVAAGGAALVLGTAERAESASARAFPGGPYYVIGCGFSHFNNDDPIAFPDQPGRSHNHTYIGARNVNASSTPASIRDGPTTCPDDGDASAYWVPTLFSGTEPVRPFAALAYYVKRTYEPIQLPPAGLKMIAGNADARRAQPTSVVSWSCGGVGATRLFATIPACAARHTLVLRVDFPNCWNGKAADSIDHKRHMAHSTAGRCPETHPVAVPAITLIVLYPPVRSARIASGRFGTHADFMNGWDDAVLGGQVAALNRGRAPDG